MSTDLTVRNKPTMLPQNLSEARGMAQLIAQSRLFGCKTEAEAFSLMLLADAEGLHPAIAARDYHIIEGRPTLRADAMLARFQAAGGSVKWVDRSNTRVVGIFSHPKGGTNEIEWTIDQARSITNKGKPLTDRDNWRNYPRQMLTARCIGEGVRTTFPGVIAGYYTPEEIEDGVIVDAVMDSPEQKAAPEKTGKAAPKKEEKAIDSLPGADILIEEIEATESVTILESLVARKTSQIISYGQGDRQRIQKAIREKRASFDAPPPPPPPPPPQEEEAAPREEEVQEAEFTERDAEADEKFIVEFVRQLHSKRVLNTVDALWDRYADRLAAIKAADPKLYDEAIKADVIVREKLEDQSA
jgi:hypothetical protein